MESKEFVQCLDKELEPLRSEIVNSNYVQTLISGVATLFSHRRAATENRERCGMARTVESYPGYFKSWYGPAHEQDGPRRGHPIRYR